LDTRISKETFEELEDFTNHPKFEYDGPVPSKFPKTKRNKEKLKESIHNSTSPTMQRTNTVKNMNLNYVSSNKGGKNSNYVHKENVIENNSNLRQKKDIIHKNMSNFPSTKNHRSMLKLHEKGFKKVTSFFERDKSASNLGVK